MHCPRVRMHFSAFLGDKAGEGVLGGFCELTDEQRRYVDSGGHADLVNDFVVGDRKKADWSGSRWESLICGSTGESGNNSVS